MNLERLKMIGFLEKYKSLPVLWNHTLLIEDKPKIRKAAWEELLQTYRKIDDRADLSMLKHKIDNLRSCYKRERKKVLRARLKGKQHTPRLWYYNLLLFVDGAEEDKEYTLSITSHDESDNYDDDDRTDDGEGEDDSAFHGMVRQMLPNKKASSVSKLTKSLENAQPSPRIARPTPKRVRPTSSTNSRPSTPTSVFLKAEDSDDSTYIVNVGNEDVVENRIETGSTAYGRTIGLQLDELDPMQKIIAEKLISEVIYYARLHQLTTDTSLQIVNKDCFL